MLVVLVGNAFRDRSSSNFTVSTNNDCFHKQKLASLSYVRLFNFIKSKYEYLNIDIMINSYKNIYSDNLLSFYNKFNKINIILMKIN